MRRESQVRFCEGRGVKFPSATRRIVISAIRSEQHDHHVEVVATLGGERGPGAEERRFLVPAAEYEVGRFGFVVDPDRHEIYEGPSSFVGWGR